MTSKHKQAEGSSLHSASHLRKDVAAEEYILHLPHRNIYLCKVCGHHSSRATRWSRKDLIRHIDAKHMKGDYPCRFCNKVLKTGYYLQRHVRKEHLEILIKERLEASVHPELDPNVKVAMWLKQNKEYLHDG